MTRTLLVTGCTGYVARSLVPELRRAAPGDRLVGTARRAAEAPAGLDAFLPADLADPEQARALVSRARPAAVVHLAARRDGGLGELLAANAVATAHLLDAVREVAGPGARVVVAGSAAEIGACAPAEMPLAEGAACRPVDPYGVAKLAQSAVAHAAFFRHGQEVVRARLFNLIGPDLPDGLLPGRCARLLVEAMAGRCGRTLAFRDLGTARDYVDVRDVARALALALERGRPGALYHVGSGRALVGRDVVRRLLEVARPDTGPVDFEETVASPRTVPVQVADPGLAARELGWTAGIPFESSARDLWRAALGRAGGTA